MGKQIGKQWGNNYQNKPNNTALYHFRLILKNPLKSLYLSAPPQFHGGARVCLM